MFVSSEAGSVHRRHEGDRERGRGWGEHKSAGGDGEVDGEMDDDDESDFLVLPTKPKKAVVMDRLKKSRNDGPEFDMSDEELEELLQAAETRDGQIETGPSHGSNSGDPNGGHGVSLRGKGDRGTVAAAAGRPQSAGAVRSAGAGRTVARPSSAGGAAKARGAAASGVGGAGAGRGKERGGYDQPTLSTRGGRAVQAASAARKPAPTVGARARGQKPANRPGQRTLLEPHQGVHQGGTDPAAGMPIYRLAMLTASEKQVNRGKLLSYLDINGE